jgi:macrodomain Ter protein organizer (MatP/YcbG family)
VIEHACWIEVGLRLDLKALQAMRIRRRRKRKANAATQHYKAQHFILLNSIGTAGSISVSEQSRELYFTNNDNATLRHKCSTCWND